MNSDKIRCRWCNNIYASGGAYSNHIQKKHSEHAQQTFPPLVRRQPDVTQVPPEREQNTASESISTLIQDPEPYSDLSDADIDPAELAGIQELYLDWLPTNKDAEAECDSDMEPIREISASTNHEHDSKPYTPDVTRRLPARYRAGQPLRDYSFSNQRSPEYNHLHPFHSARDYKLARFFTLSKVPKTRIDDFFRDNILPPSHDVHPTSDISFKSGYTFYKQTDKMIDDPPWHTGEVQYALRPKSEFRYRNLLECIQYLLRQRAFVCHMLWEPVKIFNKDNERIYSEMNTGTWWWDQQVCSPEMHIHIRLLTSDRHRFQSDPRLSPSYWRRIKHTSQISPETRNCGLCT